MSKLDRLCQYVCCLAGNQITINIYGNNPCTTIHLDCLWNVVEGILTLNIQDMSRSKVYLFLDKNP